MSTFRQSVHDYIRACDALLDLSDLSEHEMHAVETMLTRLSDAMLFSGKDSTP